MLKCLMFIGSKSEILSLNNVSFSEMYLILDNQEGSWSVETIFQHLSIVCSF